MCLFKCSTLIIKMNESRPSFYYNRCIFGSFKIAKSGCGLIFFFFSNSNVLKMCPKAFKSQGAASIRGFTVVSQYEKKVYTAIESPHQGAPPGGF